MRFCDKLAKQRKNNNLSQEQLAEKLGVSRQAVSKWESGTSYPDMEKIIQISNILNCTLEELLDDGTIKTNTNQNSKLNFNTYLQDLLKFVTKTYNMFCSMNFKQKIKCIVEVLLMAFILFILGSIIFGIVNSITVNLLDLIPFSLKFYIETIFESIYIIILLIIGIIILLHLFKIRYLDYYITIEDKNIDKKVIESEVIDKHEFIDSSRKEKIIIRDPKHSSFSFFHLLGKLVVYMIKVFVAICAIPLIGFSLFLIFATVISIVHIKYTILFFFTAIAFFGSVILSLILVYFIYNFIFSRKQPFKIIFILFVISLVFMGVGGGLACTTILNYDVYNIEDTKGLVTRSESIEVVEHTRLYLLDDYESEYIIDNSLNDVKLEISYPDVFNYRIVHEKMKDENGDDIDGYHLYVEQVDFFKIYKIVMNNLKKKRVINYPTDSIKVKIYVSQENYNRILKD